MGTFKDFYGRLQHRKSPHTWCPTTNKNVLSDPESLLKLKLELAVAIDVGEHFVKATYYLEGDGPLVFSCYEKLQAAAEASQAPHFANVRAVAAAIANADRSQSSATLEQRALACVQPAIQWFLRKFNVDLIEAVAAFKAAKVMCPVMVRWLRPTRATVEALSIFHSSTMTQPSRASPESCHSTSLQPRMWLLNVGERKLSAGRSTRRGFLIGLLQSRKCCLFSLLLLPQRDSIASSLHLSMSSKIMHSRTTFKQALCCSAV